MSMISRLRDDADLLYLYNGEKTGKKGRPRKYAGKINHSIIDEKFFELVQDTDDSTKYCTNVYSKAFKRIIKLVHVFYKMKNGKQTYKLYFSTDFSIPALNILNYY